MFNKYCVVCGAELTDENYIGQSHVCIPCQSKRFESLENANGTHVAIFLCCATYNFPCEPTLIPIDFCNFSGNKWEEYISFLGEGGKLLKGEFFRTFDDGERNIREIFGVDLVDRDFSRYIAREKQKVETLPGTEEQRERWGLRPIWKGVPVSDETYKELDRLYFDSRQSYSGITLTAQMENALINVTKLRVAANWLMSQGNPTFEKLLKSADTILASEQMRRKDEKPTEELRIDALIVALENAGLMENGDFLTFDQTKQALASMLMSKKYDYSLDVADQMLFLVQNAMRGNEDMSLLTELQDEMMLEDRFGEFSEETEQERDSRRYAGLTKIDTKKRQG